MMGKLAALLIAVAAGIGVVQAGAAQAQTFPSKPLRIIAPFPPGGAADITSRILAEHMSKGLGQPVVVENRPGGSTIIGSEVAARAPADGHTLLVVFPSFIIQPALRTGMSFDPLRDFTAVGQTISLPMAIAVHSDVPAKSLSELIALARTKPGALGYGTPGIGTTHHVYGEMFRLAMKINITHVPFQGGGPAVTAASGGHIPIALLNVAEIAPHAKSGKLRALVVTSGERAETLPDVPTFREAGYPEPEASNWAGMVVASATPPAAVARLNAELVRALRTADVQEKFKLHGMSAVPGTPEQFGAFLQAESARYGKTVREAGIKAE
jgi:tripartite-type tricarboxylate transporter receptor subunit TctC